MGTMMYTPTLWIDPSVEMFNRAFAAGRNHKFISMLTRRPSRLQDLASYQAHVNNSRYGHYAGVQEVALDDIRGTEGRLNDFDDRFHPLTERTSRSAGRALPGHLRRG